MRSKIFQAAVLALSFCLVSACSREITISGLQNQAISTPSPTLALPVDTDPPVVTSFILPLLSDSLTVTGIGVTASDNVGVTGYLLSETAEPPAFNAGEWSAFSPTTHAFSISGSQTLYAWVKDAAGNISHSASATVMITLPPNLPSGPHPRIWLTSDELARLIAKRDSGDPAWTSLRSWCDVHMSDAGYNIDPADQSKYDLTNWGSDNNYTTGYRMSGFSQQIMNYSLAYQVLKAPGPGQDLSKAAAEAARARTLMIDGIATALRSGEELNGLKAVRVGGLHDITINASEATAFGIGNSGYKQGYSSRNLAAVPISYDWIYETLSPADKDLLGRMMLRWFDWIRGTRSAYNNGVLKNGIRYYEDQAGNCSGNDSCTTLTGAATLALDYGNMSANFNGGHTYLMSLIPIALYGDNPDIPSYFDAFKNYLSNNVIDQLENDLKQSGGDSVEGWNYGGSFIRTLSGLYGYYTATGDQAIPNMKWPSSLVNAMLHRLGPNLIDVPIYGYWTGIPFGVNREAMALPFVAIEQRFRPTSDLSKVGQYLLNHATFSDSVEAWQAMLWARSDIPEATPDTLPLTYLAKGNGYFTSRSSWSDPNGVHVGVRLEGKNSASHEGYDEGDLSVERGLDRLLTHQNSVGDAPPSVSFNTVVFNNQSHHFNNVLTKAAIDRTDTGPGYAYVSGDITNAWKRQWNPDKAELFRRSVLHALPGVVIVYDVTRSNSAVGNVKDWYTQYLSTPTTSSDTIFATVGSSNIFVQTLYPQGGAFTTTSPASGYYRVKYTPAVTQEYDQFLHVITATDNNVVAAPSAALLTFGNVRGVHIQDPVKNIVALFTSDQTGAAPSDAINYSYTATSTTTDHYIADLVPGQAYDILITGTFSKTVTLLPDPAGIVRASASGGFIALSIGSDNSYVQLNHSQ